jgi:hypothetical protein
MGNKNNITDLLKKLKIDVKIFNKIKEMQQLPEEVIIKFLLAESSLSNSDFLKRMNDDQK